MGDLTGDGNLDVVVACDAGVVSVLLADGKGSFSGPRSFPAGDHPRSLALGDFTGDGRLDAAVALSDFHVAVLFGDGAGGFGPPALFSVGPGRPGWTNVSAVAVGDLNADGRLDLVSVGLGTSAVSVLIGDGTGQLAAPRLFPQFNAPRSVAVADFDGDGNLDLAVTNSGPGLTVLRGDVNGNLTFQSAVSLARAGVVATADLNRDGHPDLVAIGAEGLHAGPATVAVALGDGTGRFAPPAFYAFGPRTYAGAQPDTTQLAIADFDDDGKLDIAVPNPAGNEVAILPGLGDGRFGEAETFPTDGLGPVGIAHGDLTGSGEPDLVVANHTTDSVAILLNALDRTGTRAGAQEASAER